MFANETYIHVYSIEFPQTGLKTDYCLVVIVRMHKL